MPAIIVHDIGTAPNAGDGDSLRVAFTDVNANFAELAAQILRQVATSTNTPHNLTAANRGFLIKKTTTAGNKVVNLPSAAANQFLCLAIQKDGSDSNTVTIGVQTGEKLNGVVDATLVLTADLETAIIFGNNVDGYDFIHTSPPETASVGGLDTLVLPGGSWTPTVTDGATAFAARELTAGRVMSLSTAFLTGVDNKAQFGMFMPKGWDEGVVNYVVGFSSDSTNTGTVRWLLRAVAVSDNDSLDAVFGTEIALEKAHSGTAEDLDITGESGDLTVGGPPAEGDWVVWEIEREGTNVNDTFTGTAFLEGVKILFTRDADTDDKAWGLYREN